MSRLSFKTVLITTLFVVFMSVQNYAQEATIHVEVDTTITKLANKRLALLKSGQMNTHFSIQTYSGNMSTARETLLDCKKTFIDDSSKMVYETPNYKVWIGIYRTKLDADRALTIISKTYPDAFIFKPKSIETITTKTKKEAQ